METTVWKEKCVRNKPNIYTSIQCVVSRGVTLGKLGVSQSRDCTQWGNQSHFLFKWSQTDKQFWVDSFINPSGPVHHRYGFALGFRSGATSCLTKLISTTTVLLWKKLQAGPEKQKKGLWDSAPTQTVSQVSQGLRSSVGFATFPPIVDWVDWGQGASEPMPSLFVERRYWSVS